MKRLLLSTFFLLVPLSAGVLNIPVETQQKDQWCWAGTSRALLTYYGDLVSQGEIVQYAYGDSSINQWNWIYGHANVEYNGKTYNPHGINEILAQWNTPNTYLFDSLTQRQFKDEIDAGHPFFIRWGWSSGGGHFVLGIGYPTGETFQLMDPWYGKGHTIAAYDYVTHAEYRGEWTHTLKTNRTPGGSSATSSSSSKPSSSSVSSSSGVVGTVDCQGLSAWTAKSYDWVSNNPPGECFTYQGQKWCHHHWVNEIAPPQNSGWTLYGTCATGSSSSSSSSSSKPSSSSVSSSSSRPSSSSSKPSSSSMSSSSSKPSSSSSSSVSSSSSSPSSSSVSSSSFSSSLLSSSSTSSSSSDPSVSSDAPSSSSTDDQTGGIDRIAELSPFRVISVDRLTYRVELPESSPWQLVGWNGRLLQQGLGSGVVDLSPYSDGLYLLRAPALRVTKKLLRAP